VTIPQTTIREVELTTKCSSSEVLPVAEAKGSFAHLILNPGAGCAAASPGRLTEAASEGGIRVGVLEPGEVVKHAALAAAEDGAQVLGVAGGDGSVAGGGHGTRVAPCGGAHGHP
jgi:hypothetical protein